MGDGEICFFEASWINAIIRVSTRIIGPSVSGIKDALILVTTAQRLTVRVASPVSGPTSTGESLKKSPFLRISRTFATVEVQLSPQGCTDYKSPARRASPPRQLLNRPRREPKSLSKGTPVQA
jgi:hypothetical protein